MLNSESTIDLFGTNLLVVEDDDLLRRRIVARLESLGADVTQAGSLAETRGHLQTLDFDYALMDVNLPDGHSTELLKEKALSENTGVIVMTAHGGIKGAVEAIQLGALDYLAKPFELTELVVVLEKARRSRQSARVDAYKRQREDGEGLYFGKSLAPLREQMDKMVRADQRLRGKLPPVLIQGETGSGKTAIARWLHRHGPRADQDMVEVNCSALPESLAESELFGHEKGAFTDARNARMGLFEAADRSTLFLDEISSLPLPLQAKVLTAIEDQNIRRVGGNHAIPVDVRIIAASNRDLTERVAAGQFREDLLHRLDLYRVTLPPLRQRGEDILELAARIMETLCKNHRLPPRQITALGRRRLLAYAWPGNVRELAHELERAIVFEEGTDLAFENLDPETAAGAAASESVPDSDWLIPSALFEEFSLDQAIDRFIKLAMERSGGNVSGAARLLQVPRDFIRYRLKKQKETLKPEPGTDSQPSS